MFDPVIVAIQHDLAWSKCEGQLVPARQRIAPFRSTFQKGSATRLGCEQGGSLQLRELRVEIGSHEVERESRRQMGRAARRERVCQHVSLPEVGVTLNNNHCARSTQLTARTNTQ